MGLGGLVGILFAALALGAGIRYRRRLAGLREDPARLDDELIRRIEAEGEVDLEEPLDLAEAREEEDRFWSEPWDEPDEW